jgi:hypothetical protein
MAGRGASIGHHKSMNGRKHGQRRKRGQIGIVGGKAALGEKKRNIFFM